MTQPPQPPPYQPTPAPGAVPPPAGPPRRRRGRSKPKGPLVTGVVMAVALVIGGVWFATGGKEDGKGSPDSPGAAAELLHTVPRPKVAERTDTVGMWTTDKNFVKAGAGDIRGYPLKGGVAEWTVPLGGAVCWSAPHPTEDGRTAVLFQDGEGNCTWVGLVDLTAGELLWKRRTVERGSTSGYPVSFEKVAVGGGTVAAGGNSGGAGWSLEGKRLWMPDREAPECPVDAYAGDGDKLVALRECGTSEPGPDEIQTLDAGTGKARSSYRLPSDALSTDIASLDPLVLAVHSESGGESADRLVTVDDSAAEATARSRIEVTRGYELDCGSGLEGCKGVVVHPRSGLLYLGSESGPTQDKPFLGNTIVAFDLKTGRKAGETEAERGRTLLPVGTGSDGSVYALRTATTTESGGLWRIGPKADGAAERLRFPAGKRATEEQFARFGELEGQVLYTRGRVYMGALEIDDTPGRSQVLAAVYGER